MVAESTASDFVHLRFLLGLDHLWSTLAQAKPNDQTETEAHTSIVSLTISKSQEITKMYYF